MKKLLLLMLISALFIVSKANAQCCDSVVITHTNVISTAVNDYTTSFSWYITADGWLYYDLEAPSDDESDVYFAADQTVVVAISQQGGGPVVGSVYLGTTDITDLSVVYGSGYFGTPVLSEDEGDDYSVTFGSGCSIY